MTNIYTLAGLNIRVTSLYDAVHRFCAEYLSSGPDADFDVRTGQEEIDFERGRFTDGLQRQDAFLEILAVYRKIAEKTPDYGIFLMHGSALALDGEAYLFTAESGTGKSTHARLWREVFGDRVVMVNDDKPLVKVTRDGAVVYGTPWNGKHRLGENISAPLKAVAVLERAKENSVRRITVSEAYPTLVRQIYRPADPRMLEKTLTLIDLLTEKVGLYRLGCNMEREAALVSYSGMKGTP